MRPTLQAKTTNPIKIDAQTKIIVARIQQQTTADNLGKSQS
jgi:hypothetical protein